MKFLKTYKLFEKTSLINLSVPFVVMKQVQRDYSISGNAQWQQIKYKKDFILTIKKNKNTLIISVGKNRIFIVFSYNNDYYIETYIQILDDDFGNTKWQRNDRIKATLDEITKMIYTRGCKSYELLSGNWSHEFSNIRKIRKENTDFDNIILGDILLMKIFYHHKNIHIWVKLKSHQKILKNITFGKKEKNIIFYEIFKKF